MNSNKRPLPPSMPPPTKVLQRMNPSEAIRNLGSLDKIKLWGTMLTVLLNDMESETEASAVRMLLFEEEMAQNLIFAMKHLESTDDARVLLKIIVTLLCSNISNSNLSVSDGSGAVNFLQSMGLHGALLELLTRMRRDQTIVQLCYQCLSTVYSLSSDEVIKQTFAKPETHEDLINMLIEARRLHLAVTVVRDQFVVLILNLSARCPASMRNLIVEATGNVLVSIGRFACEGEKSSQTMLLAEDVLGAIHNLCFDDPSLAKSLRKNQAYELAVRALHVFETEWTVVCAAITVIGDLATMATAPESGVPVGAVSVVRESTKRYLKNERVAQAGMIVLQRLLLRDDCLREFVKLEELAEGGFVAYDVLSHWKDRSLDLSERALTILSVELGGTQTRIHFKFRALTGAKQTVTDVMNKYPSRPKLYYSGRRVLMTTSDE